jgi:hypothetical protein
MTAIAASTQLDNIYYRRSEVSVLGGVEDDNAPDQSHRFALSFNRNTMVPAT